MSVDEIIYKGISFKRYPDSRNWADKSYYRPHSGYIKEGVGALHREIWKDERGEIPSGYHIHHKDNNPLNNDIENLACIPSSDHHAIHAEWGTTPEHSEWRKRHLEEIRPLTKEWHGSEEGKAWHSEHAREIWEKSKENPVSLECVQCGSTYETLEINRSNSKFCSNRCKSAFRRDSGVDDEDRKCLFCGETFRVNKYNSKKFCSPKCMNGSKRKE